MSQESAHGQGNNNEHVSVHTEAYSFTPPVHNEPVNQQNVGNNPNAGGQPDVVIPAFLANVLQQIANAPMFQPPPPLPPRVITYKTLRDNGAKLFLGDRIGEPQIAWDWIEETGRVLEDLNGDMTLPEYRQKFTKLAKFAPTLVSTPTDRIEDFRKKLRPDLKSRVSVLTTMDFAEDYDLIARAGSNLSACIEYLKTNNVSSSTHRPFSSASKGKRPFQESSSSYFSKKGKSVQTQLMASVDKSRKRRYPACEHCGRNHPGECWLTQGLCLGCGKPGHFRKECPTNPGEPFPPAPVVSQAASTRPAPSQCSTAGSNPAKNQNQQQGRARARTYAMKAQTEENPNVIQGSGGVTRLKHFVRFASVRRPSARESQQPQQPSRTFAAVDARDSERRPRLVPPSRAAGRRNQGRVAAANSLRFKFNSSFFEVGTQIRMGNPEGSEVVVWEWGSYETHFVRFASVRRPSARESQQPQQPSRTFTAVVAVDARDSDRRPRLVPPSRAAGWRNQGRVAAANSLRFKFNSSFFEANIQSDSESIWSTELVLQTARKSASRTVDRTVPAVERGYIMEVWMDDDPPWSSVADGGRPSRW
ncbi:unnamed protein product [Cuscuta campestris]|uniref:CCHC-type domain-containing protein n=1 Tax=Cuscuta campestris TaxID=132261 RepID=A0A484MP31_9ASTE|nr:unnamed protein product [Cuscuta campestris]